MSLNNKSVNKLRRVCVAMSGGVDSSVAAAILCEQGYEVSGAFMKNWSLEQSGVSYKPWEDEAYDAEAVCKQLNIKFQIFDFEGEYEKRVVDSFVNEYKVGRTPNPDVLCNKEIKFDLFLNKARKLGFDKIATGHYAQVKLVDDEYCLSAGVDPDKDQSYFLYTLTQKELPYVLFPIGHLHKSEVRKIAKSHKLINAEKKDSQGICFIGPVAMSKFLQHYLKTSPGKVMTADGEVIGEHDGVIYYTEGQRHGFDTGGSHTPLYVAEKRVEENELVVVPSDHPLLYTTKIDLEEPTWTGSAPILPCDLSARVRYHQILIDAILVKENEKWKLTFEQPVRAVSPGQAAVFYLNDRVLGGATIRGKIK